MNSTDQTLAIAGATIVAALLGVIIGFLGTAYLQGRQAKRAARDRLAGLVAELLASAQDVLIGVRTIRHAHERRTQSRSYLRLAAMMMRDYPVPDTWRNLTDLSRLRSLLATVLEADRYQLDESRAIALDSATLVATKMNRYLAVAVLLSLGEDKDIAGAVRKLTAKVTALIEGAPTRKGQYKHLEDELQKGIEDFRDLADRHLRKPAHSQV